MNRDEILKMKTGRELDALIAEKVMGWKLHPHETHWGIPINGKPPYYYTRLVGDFEPSADISAAWEVAEKKRIALVPLEGGGWAACADEDFDLGWGWYEREVARWVNATSAPLAICRAALLAVMEAL